MKRNENFGVTRKQDHVQSVHKGEFKKRTNFQRTRKKWKMQWEKLLKVGEIKEKNKERCMKFRAKIKALKIESFTIKKEFGLVMSIAQIMI